MATTQNTYTGDNSTVSYSFTFPYLEETDIKVSLDGVVTTAYTLSNATTVTFNTAPGSGVAIRIYRDTNNDALAATFFAGSAIRAQDLNEDFLQNAYVTQEVKDRYLDRLAGGSVTGDVAITGDVTLTGAVGINGTLDMNGNRIIDMADPTSDQDAATKFYIDTRLGDIGIPGHTRWRKTATASQTTFSGTGDYGGTLAYTATREQVYLNGALQQRGVDYTADDGDEIVFSVALTAGDIVDIVCVNNLNASTVADAANINYGSQFTGQTTRTVAAKLAEVVSVTDFGADPTGATDSTAAIQAAIDANKAVYIPYGIYKITSTITLNQSYSAIIGDTRLPIIRYYNPGNGPAINVTAVPAGAYNQHSRVENLIIEARDSGTGAYWQPTFSSTPNVNEAGIAFQATAYGANAVQRCTGRNLRIFNFSVAVWNHNTVDQRIDDIRIQMAANIPDGAYTAANKCIGIFCDGTPGGGFSPNASIEITNCTFGMGGCPEIATRIGIYAYGSDLRDIWVTGGVYSQGDYGIWMESTGTDSNMDIHLIRVMSDQSDVAGIYLKNLSASGAISIIGGYSVISSISTGGGGLVIDGCKGVSVSGGYQALGLSENDSNDRGIYIKNSTNISVSDALVQNCFNGIVLDASNYCSITGNIVCADTARETTPSLTNGIQLANASSYNIIAANSVAGASAAYKYTTGISIPSGCVRNVVTGNQFDYTTITNPAAISDTTTSWVGPIATAGTLNLRGPTEGTALWAGSTQMLKVTPSNWVMKDMAETDGVNCIHVRNGTEPTGNPSLGGVIYTQGGELRYKGSSGTVTIIAPA